MQDKIVVKAPAKLNLFLRILGKTINGYHKIYTGITFLNLYDQVIVSLSNKNGSLFHPMKRSVVQAAPVQSL